MAPDAPAEVGEVTSELVSRVWDAAKPEPTARLVRDMLASRSEVDVEAELSLDEMRMFEPPLAVALCVTVEPTIP